LSLNKKVEVLLLLSFQEKKSAFAFCSLASFLSRKEERFPKT